MLLRKNNQVISDLNVCFLKNGFRRIEFPKIKIKVIIGDDYYNFPYETNKMFTIEKHDISIAVGQRNKERYLFISKVADGLFEGDTSPYRTFYKGLMKEPFTLVYQLEDKTKIHITQNKVIEISLQ